MKAQPRSRAFTLVELLVVVTVIGLLSAILVPVAGRFLKRGQQMREVNAARQIMIAYGAYAAANDGQLLPGLDKTAGDVSLPDGTTITGVMCERYPWRLAPFIGTAIDDIFLINDTRKRTDHLRPQSTEYQYLASLFPALGINGYCVGGYEDGSGSGHFSSDVVRRIGGAARPSRLIVFASARYTENNMQGGVRDNPGFHMVTPPRLFRTSWTRPFDRKRASTSFGNVDLRWDGKAVCAFLDGHVEMLGEPEIVDMRLWSNMAAENNNPAFAVPR